MPRDKLDRYYTPPKLARACVAELLGRMEAEGLPVVSDVLEPSIGSGAFADAVGYYLPELAEVIGVDADPSAPARREHLVVTGDFLQYDWMRGACVTDEPGRFYPDSCKPRPHLVIGNPPYRDAEAHVAHALETTARHVAFLLRASLLGSSRRAAGLWKSSPLRHVWHISPRPSFTGDGGTDGAEYAFFWWDKCYSGDATLSWLTWEK